jgi:hypothetical protein
MSNMTESADNFPHFLGHVLSKGVRLWMANGQLHYTAPKGALTREELAVLRNSKSQILAQLAIESDAGTAEDALGSRPRFHNAPLSSAQLAHWHTYWLASGPVVRGVSRGVRLVGQLNMNALRTSFVNLICRHDALRTQVWVDNGVPLQKIAQSCPFDLAADDLTALSASSGAEEADRLIERFLLTRINVALDPLFSVRLIRLRYDEHLLIVAVEHVVSDGLSMTILFRDVLTGYAQASRALPISLPSVQLQLSDYAACQHNARDVWVRQHGTYWNVRLAGCQRTIFPDSKVSSNTTGDEWGSVPVGIHRDMTKALREWCRRNQTTIVMVVFAAYAAAVLRWCGVSEAVFQYIIGGRDSPKLENTIGCFAAALHLRIALHDDDVFPIFSNRVKEEYCMASAHVDYSYIEAQEPRPAFARNCFFNWLPEDRPPGPEDSQTTLVSTPFEIPSVISSRDSEPGMVLREQGSEVVGALLFPTSRLSAHDMERFVRDFTHLIRNLVSKPAAQIKGLMVS